ncbi:MAG: DMT family transporter [Candidatus Bathyarchaeota archaeon]|nr:DMT family transporter [Candidatus Bathyarchaeota archaeon]
MTFASACWAGAFIAGKLGLSDFTPLTMTLYRYLIATIIIIPYMLKTEGDSPKPKWNDLPQIFMLSLTGIIGYHLLFFGSLQYTSSINSSMIASLKPIMASILAIWVVNEKLTIQRLTAITIALAGVILTITNGDFEVIRSLTFNQGDIMMLGASLCHALYGVLSRRVSEKFTPTVVVSYTFLLSTIALIPFTLNENPIGVLVSSSWIGLASVVYMGVFPSFLAYIIQQNAIKTMGVNWTMPFYNLATVFSIIFAVLLLGEQMTLVKALSAGVIMFGVYLNSRIKS